MKSVNIIFIVPMANVSKFRISKVSGHGRLTGLRNSAGKLCGSSKEDTNVTGNVEVFGMQGLFVESTSARGAAGGGDIS